MLCAVDLAGGIWKLSLSVKVCIQCLSLRFVLVKAIIGSAGVAEAIGQLKPQEHSEAALGQPCEQCSLD